MERTLHGYGYKPNQLLHHVNGNLILLKPWPSTKLQLMQKLEAFYYSLFTVYWNSSDVSKFRPSEFVTLRLVCNFKRVKNPIHFVKISKWVKNASFKSEIVDMSWRVEGELFQGELHIDIATRCRHAEIGDETSYSRIYLALKLVHSLIHVISVLRFVTILTMFKQDYATSPNQLILKWHQPVHSFLKMDLFQLINQLTIKKKKKIYI